MLFVSLDSVGRAYEGGTLDVAFDLFKGELYVVAVFVGEVLFCTGFFTDIILTGDLYVDVLVAFGEVDDKDDEEVIVFRAGELLDFKLDVLGDAGF